MFKSSIFWILSTLSKPCLKNTCTYSDDKNPFDQGEAEATDGSVAPCDGIGQTEGQAEPDPVEQEGHWWRNIGQDFSNNQKKRYDLI